MASLRVEMEPRVEVEKVVVKCKRPRARIDRSFATAMLALREYFKVEKVLERGVNLDRVVDRAAQALQVSRDVAPKIKSEESLEEFRESDEKETRARAMSLPYEMAEAARATICEMHSKEKVMPTVSGVFARLKESGRARSSAWKWPRATLHRHMGKIGFTFGARSTYYEYVTERPDIRQQRASHIRWIRQHRSEGYEIFYQDETWVFKNIAQSKIWMREKVDVECRAPSGAGMRSIISHAGSSKSGLLDGGLLMHRGSASSKSSGCRSEMSGEVFLGWLEKRALPKLQEKGKRLLALIEHHAIL